MKKRIVFLLTVFTLILLVGCNNKSLSETPQNEYGFVDSESDDTDTVYRCAYKLPETEFYKSNVTVEFFYGQIDFMFGEGSGTVFKVFVAQDNLQPMLFDWDADAYFFKEISGEEFYSEEYFCYGRSNEEGKTVLEFAHSETVKIPERFFDKEEGSISLGIIEYHSDDQTYGSLKSVRIIFRTEGDSVILSVPEK